MSEATKVSTTTRRVAISTAGALLLAASTQSPDSPADDADLIGLCRRFDELEAIVNDCHAGGRTPISDDEERDQALAGVWAEQETLLDQICAAQATTKAGFVARATTLVNYDEFALGGDDEDSCWPQRMRVALLRDLIA